MRTKRDKRDQYLSIVEAYDQILDEWTQKADMPTKRVSSNLSVVNGKIYAIGGWNFDDWLNVEEYDPAANTWTKKAKLPTERTFFSTSVVNDKIYVIGGWGNNAFLSTVEVYDPLSNEWRKKADMPTARNFFSTSVVDGKIYAIGGASNMIRRRAAGLSPIRRGTIPTVEVYDPGQDTWTEAPDMPTARRDLATAVVRGRIYAIGGKVGMRGEGIPTVEVYDTGLGVKAGVVPLRVEVQ